jgi:hypothetical protein
MILLDHSTIVPTDDTPLNTKTATALFLSSSINNKITKGNKSANKIRRKEVLSKSGDNFHCRASPLLF